MNDIKQKKEILKNQLLTGTISESEYTEKLAKLIKEPINESDGKDFMKKKVFWAYDGNGNYLGEIKGNFSSIMDGNEFQKSEEFMKFKEEIAPDKVARVKGEVVFEFQGRPLKRVKHPQTQEMCLYERNSDQYFTEAGQRIDSQMQAPVNEGKEEIKPCPDCGSKAAVVKTYDGQWCKSCHQHVTESINENRSDFEVSYEYDLYDAEGNYVGEIASSDDYYDINDLIHNEDIDTFSREIGKPLPTDFKKHRIYKYQGRELDLVNYGSTGTNALYDRDTDTFFNQSGQMLRDPEDHREITGGDYDW